MGKLRIIFKKKQEIVAPVIYIKSSREEDFILGFKSFDRGDETPDSDGLFLRSFALQKYNEQTQSWVYWRLDGIVAQDSNDAVFEDGQSNYDNVLTEDYEFRTGTRGTQRIQFRVEANYTNHKQDMELYSNVVEFEYQDSSNPRDPGNEPPNNDPERPEYPDPHEH